ncbi:hypothetical protein F4818DRAFT_332367 [Hypoxylon cercidicola]|nr:hypothetical protein F4818DRAFT_332367 [Hypoxylon cercidicola]
MPPKPRTVKIPESDWACHKEKILEMFLLSERTLKEIADYMEANHKFAATISQYEAQLRVWKARRRLAVHEWDSIFKRLNNLDPDTKSRVVLSGRPIPDHQIRRARRHWKSKSVRERRSFLDDRGTTSESTDAYIEVQSPGGSWRQLADTTPVASNTLQLREFDSTQPHEVPMLLDSSQSTQMVWQHDQANALSRRSDTGVYNGLAALDNLALATFEVHVPDSPDFASYLEQNPNSPMSWAWKPSGSRTSTRCTSLLPGAGSVSPPDCLRSEVHPISSISVVPFRWLENLSYMAFENTAASQGLTVYGSISLGRNDTHLLLDSQDIQRYMSSDLIRERTGKNWKIALNTLRTLLPGNVPRIGGGNSQSLLAADDILDSKFIRLLLFSMANGLAGLEGTPMEEIIKFLARSQSMNRLFMKCLKAMGGYTAKSLAETLFRVSIEIDGNNVASQLLDTGLVDVNSPLSSNPPRRAIEEAVSRWNLELVELLLNANADPTKEFLRILTREGRHGMNSPISTTWLRIWNECWKQRPINLFEEEWPNTPSDDELKTQWRKKLPFDGVEWSLEAIQLYLSEIVHPTEHCHLFEIKFLAKILRAASLEGETPLADSKATDAIRKIFDICQQAGCGKCLEKYSKHVRDAAIIGASHNYFNFVKLLIPHCDNNYLNVILSISMMERQDSLAALALDRIKSLNISPMWIIPERHASYETKPIWESVRQLLAAAILTKNVPMVHYLEAAGVLDGLYYDESKNDKWFPFRETLVAAVKVQDVDYVRKLLLLYPSVPFEEIQSALEHSISRHCDEITFELLSTIGNDNLACHRKDLLTKAIQADKAGFFFATNSFLVLAAVLGDIEHLRMHLANHPDEKYYTLKKAFGFAIDNCHYEIALELLDAGASVNGYGTPLTKAVMKRNPQLVRAIMSADIGRERIEKDFLKHALPWGDRSIINDLISIHSVPDLTDTDQTHLFGSVLPEMDCDLIRYCLSKRGLTESQLKSCLASAVEQNDGPKIQLFLEYSEYLYHKRLFEGLRLDTLHALLPIIRPNQNMVTLGFGADMIRRAIEDGDSLEDWDQLLSSGMIDLEGHTWWTGKTDDLSPLGAAMERYGRGEDPGFTITKKLLDAGCSVNTIARRGRVDTGIPMEPSIVSWTVLLSAVQTKDEELVQLLIDRGADVHQAAALTVKRTPLQQAAEVGSLEIVKLLIKHNVDVNAAPSARGGGTALQFAAISGNCNIAAELLSHGASINAPPSKVNGRWPIEGAAEHGRLTMLEYLWIAKGNTVFPDGDETGFEEKHCRRAMELAEKNGHIACRDFMADMLSFNV